MKEQMQSCGKAAGVLWKKGGAEGFYVERTGHYQVQSLIKVEEPKMENNACRRYSQIAGRRRHGLDRGQRSHVICINHVMLVLVPLSLLGSIDKWWLQQTGESEQLNQHKHRLVYR